MISCTLAVTGPKVIDNIINIFKLYPVIPHFSVILLWTCTSSIIFNDKLRVTLVYLTSCIWFFHLLVVINENMHLLLVSNLLHHACPQQNILC